MKKEQTVDTNNGFVVPAFLAFLDSVIAECTLPDCLSQADKARIRRAKNTFALEKADLERTLQRLPVDQQNVAIPYSVFSRVWPTLCKRAKYELLAQDYSVDVRKHKDFRYPTDGRQVPSYAKDALSQLRTLDVIARTHWKEQGLIN